MIAERERMYLAAYLRDEFVANDLIFWPVAPFNQMIGSDKPDKVQRGIFVKWDDAIDAF